MRPEPGTDRLCSDPEVARIHRRRDGARALSSAMERAGASEAVVAAHLGVSRSRVHHWRDGEHAAQIGLGDLAGLPPDVLRDICAWLLAPSGRVVADVPGASDADALLLAAESSTEHAEAIACLLAALRDRLLTRAEGAEIVRECNEAISRLLAIREWGERAIREGVVAVPLRRAK